jgi:flagellar motor switch protein FliN/FliY
VVDDAETTAEVDTVLGASQPDVARDDAAAPAPSPAPAPRALDALSNAQIAPYTLEELAPAEGPSAELNDLGLILDVDLNVRVELGRAQLYIEEVLKLREGSIIPLEKLAGDPVDIYVNGRVMARGEVLVLNDNFCVRISEILGDELENPTT